MNKFVFILFFLSFLPCMNAQSVFQRIYGNSTLNYLWDIENTHDGGYYILGIGNSTVNITTLTKINQSGQIIWSRQYTTSFGNYGLDIIGTADSGLLITGICYSGSNPSTIYLAKLDSLGGVQWMKQYSDTVGNYHEGVKVIIDYDGNYIVGGSTLTNGYENSAIYIIKVNSLGDTIFTRKMNNPYRNTLRDIILTQDSSYLVTGSMITYDSSNMTSIQHIVLAKFNKNGQLDFARTYVDSLYNVGIKSLETAPGEYITLCYKPYGTIYYDETIIVKTNDAGNILWQKAIYTNMSGGHFVAEDLLQTPDNGFLMCGSAGYYFSHNNCDSSSSVLVKTDSVGNVSWAKSYGVAHHNYGASAHFIRNAINSGYLMGGGIRAPYGYSNSDMYLLKTDNSGDAGCNYVNVTIASVPIQLKQDSFSMQGSGMLVSTGSLIDSTYFLNDTLLCQIFTGVETDQDSFSLMVFPNPTNDILYILNINYNTSKNYRFELFDITGKKVKESSLNYEKQHLSLKYLMPGIYFGVLLADGDVVGKAKVVVVRD